jgi:peptidyl-Lys metalloendopeptidase
MYSSKCEYFALGPESVIGIDNLKVITTITNTGDESLKILNDPRGPLSKIPTDTFAITDAAGSKPDFTGVKVKYVPENVLTTGKEDAFTVLAPGTSATVEHDRMHM